MKRSPLKRKTPLRSLPAKKRSPTKRRLSERPPSQRCAVRGCQVTRVQIVVSPEERYCNKHGTAKADDACRAYCYSVYRRCVACGRGDEGVQWCHLHSRSMRYLRWDRDNFVGMCARCHRAYTLSPANWLRFLEGRWPGLYEALLHRELWAEHVGSSIDVAAVILCYRNGIEWRMPDPPAEFLAARVTRFPAPEEERQN